MKLEPCPFCGFGAQIIDKLFSHFWTYFKVQCHYCRASTDFYKSEKEAIKKWNTRRGEGK